MKKILLAAAVLALATPAHAYTPEVCELGVGVAVCGGMMVNPSPKIIEVAPSLHPDADGLTETRAHWRNRCKPTLSRRDPNTGMQYRIWAERGCEYGPE